MEPQQQHSSANAGGLQDTNPYASPSVPDSAHPSGDVSDEGTAEPIRVQGTLSVGEVMAAVQARRTPLRRGISLGIFCLGGYFIIRTMTQNTLGPGWAILYALGIGGCFLLLIKTLVFFSFRRFQRRGINGFQPHVRIISEQGIYSETDTIRSEMSWPAFSGGRLSKRGLTLALTDYPNQTIIIPRRLFDSETDWERCVELVQRKLLLR